MSERGRHWLAMAITAGLHLLPVVLLCWVAAPAPVPAPVEETRISLRLIAPPAAPPRPLEEKQAPQPTQAAPDSAAARTRTPPPPQPTQAREGLLQASAERGTGTAPRPADAVPTLSADTHPAQAAVTAAPPAPEAPPAVQMAGIASEQWEAKLMAHLERYRYYPAAARSRRQEGIVWVRATITRDGRLQALRLERSSGQPMLDDAALKTFRRAQPLPRIPDDMPAPQELAVPVDYFLRQAAALGGPRS
ncbi:MAG: hypothetical protein GAK31_03916 [Stenotrophomonas maltophilia]|uniref:TonB C-terminal domain-containing protein n=1 Tax=Stenotrophomonas maltophilia TaxID=40324 RepID=A0A7V8FD29_STEMA|nr:MAG: hypothetical protein GAK31_03916 [Stenotrophomonas maltophilia]